MERRERVRVKLRRPCMVGDDSRRVRSHTENVSRNGMLLRWYPDQWGPAPDIGDRLEIQLDLPSHPSFGERCLDFRGTVMRVSNAADGGLLIAVRSRSAQFRTATQKLMYAEPVNGLVH